VPPAIAYLLAGVLVLAAARLLQLRRPPPDAGDGIAALMLGAMAAVAAWIAAGPGARLCGLGAGGRPLVPGTSLACRVPFGVGAVVTALMAAYAIRRWLRSRRAP
jgi:hypothetical protein